MLKVESPKAFNELVKAFRARKGKPLTNCFLMPDETQRLTDEGKMFYGEFEDWLLFICDRDDYYSFFYYTVEASDTEDVKKFIGSIKDKDVFADIVSRAGTGDRLTPEKLVNQGAAQKYKTYQRMQFDMKNTDFSTITAKLHEDYSLSTQYCDCEKIVALWKNALDEKSTPLPKDEELHSFASEGHLYTALDREGELAAVIVLAVSGRQGLLQHLSVSAEHRRKGLADFLMKNGILSAHKEGLSALRLWVDCVNTPAVALYDRLGFVTDGMLCEQLYMKGI